MTPLNIDFKPAFPWPRLLALGAMSGLTLGSCLLMWELKLVWDQAATVSRLEAAARAELRTLQSQKRAAREPSPYLDALAELVHLSSFQVDDALAALERVDVPGTRVIDFFADCSEHRATAVIEASSPIALQAYLEGLGGAGSDARWRLRQIKLATAPVDGAADRSLQGAANSASRTYRDRGDYGMGGAGLGQAHGALVDRGLSAASTNLSLTLSWKTAD